MRRHALLVALLPCAILTGCATPGPVAQAPGIVRANLDELPVPDRAYTLAPFDVVKVEVFGQPEMTRTIEIGEDGNIQFPFVGAINAAQQKPEQIAAAIEQGLRDRYVKNPQVSVSIERAHSRQVFVGGEVSRPGAFPITGSLTLAQSVMLAGGTDEFAKLDDVVVMREAQGRKWLALYNLGAIRRGNYRDPQLYPGDTVVVGDSPARRQLITILQYLPLITQPLVAYDRATN